MNRVPIAEIIADEIDARAGYDRVADCIPWLEKVFTRWQLEGGAANFPLIVAVATPHGATIFHSEGWADADGCCEPVVARHTVLATIEARPSTKNTDIIAAGLSLLLGPEGRARQQRDADEVRARGSVPLVVALLAPDGGDDVEILTTTVAIMPRMLH
jgi:hypothetical protein